MKNKKYTPIDPDFMDTITNEKNKSEKLSVHYFNEKVEWDTHHGEFETIENQNDGDYLILTDSTKIRLDRIITVNGKIGPAHDEFDAYANECMDCSGGYDNL